MRRRSFFLRLPVLAGFLGSVLALSGKSRLPALAALDPRNRAPALASDLVRQVVASAHRDLAAVAALVEADPTLVNACWDWGAGDYETPLGAAGHVGQRAIALWLLERGARPEVFAAAMLGHLKFVQAAVEAFPGLVWTPGPHGFSLVHHARVGGEAAAPVLAWLASIDAPDTTKI